MGIVQTKYGPIAGIKKFGYTAYLGIPYAKKPIGDLAFRKPEEPEYWDGILQATRGSKNPIQEKSVYGVGNTSEDCLYMNVFVPDDLDEKVPVMVWIYGGSYKIGGAGRQHPDKETLEYELGYFAKQTKTIVVSFNFRMNVFGFLNLNTLSDRFDVNIGLYDQALALKFVKENIEAFGGDPDNITVFGHSSGAACVLALMVSPISKSYFNKAILQSPCIDHFFTVEESKKMARLYLKLAGLSQRFPESIITLPLEHIEKTNELFSNLVYLKGELRCAFSPVIDGKFLPDDPKKLVSKCDIPLIIGSTKSEANLFVPEIPDFLLRLYAPLTGIKIKNISKSYRQNFCDSLTQSIYKKPIEEIAHHYPAPAYVYEYQYVCDGFKKRGLGACHTSELAVEFGWDSWAVNPSDPNVKRVGDHMREVYRDFVYNQLDIPDYKASGKKIIFK